MGDANNNKGFEDEKPHTYEVKQCRGKRYIAGIIPRQAYLTGESRTPPPEFAVERYETPTDAIVTVYPDGHSIVRCPRFGNGHCHTNKDELAFHRDEAPCTYYTAERK